MAQTASPCPSSFPFSAPSATFQSLPSLSVEQVASVVPSGENAKSYTAASWALMVLNSLGPSVSQITTLPSSPAVAKHGGSKKRGEHGASKGWHISLRQKNE